MIDRYYERHGRRPQGVAADNTYGNGELLQWLDERGIIPYIRVKEYPTADINWLVLLFAHNSLADWLHCMLDRG
jgi:hypothetical protein